MIRTSMFWHSVFSLISRSKQTKIIGIVLIFSKLNVHVIMQSRLINEHLEASCMDNDTNKDYGQSLSLFLKEREMLI